MKFDVNIDLDLTATVITGAYIVFILATICLFVMKESFLAVLSIGSGLMGFAKGMNTLYDNAHMEEKIDVEVVNKVN